MAGFDDVITQALPYLAVEVIEATQGTTWDWSYTITDNNGDLVNMTSGFTGTLSVRDTAGVEVTTATVTFPATGIVRCAKTAAAAASVTPGHYQHELTITRTSDSAKVIAVGAGYSEFKVLRKVS